MTDDRTKLPPMFHATAVGEAVTAAWAYIDERDDRIRAEERERLATAVEQGESPLPWDCDGTFAAWLRAGGEAP